MRWAALSILCCSAAFGQLQVSLFDGTTERALTPVTDLGSVAMGDVAEFRFHARNNSSSGIALQTLAIAGQSYSISDRPTMPYIVAPANFVEFRVRFAPVDTGSYSASVAVNGASTLLRATATAAPVLTVDSSGPAAVLASGAAIDFGRILKKTSAMRTFHLANASATALTVQSMRVTGADFHCASCATALTLAAGASMDFQISFDPQAAGQSAGTLSIDSRTFALTGVAYEPPFPKPSVAITGSAVSAAQPKLSILLASASGLAGSGTLTMDFQPSVAGAGDDAAVMFPGTGSRRLTFQVAEGSTSATFGSAGAIPFQTGTTSGTITFTVQLGDYAEKSTVVIAPAVVSSDTITAARRVSDLDVTIIGFDNTHTAGRFNFTFYDAAGQAVPPGAIKVDSTVDFSRYFQISRVGGSFLMRATFPTTGDASQVKGVEIEMINLAGSTRTARVQLQ